MDYSKLSNETLSKISNNEPLDYSKLSDEELQEISKASPSTKPSAIEAPKDVSKIESALRGAADYASFGFADEATGALENLLTGKPYEQARDESRSNYKLAAEENPVTYHGAGLASAFAIPIGGIGGMATKGASLASKIGRSATMGAGMGALAGAGTSEASDTTDILKDTAKGALAGAIVAPALEGGITGISRLGKASYENIAPVKAIIDTGKFAAKGERIAGEEGGRITTEKALKSSEEVVKGLKSIQEAKNKAYRTAEETSDFTVKLKEIKDKIKKAEDQGADPAQLKNLKNLLRKLSGEEVAPAEDELANLMSETYTDSIPAVQETIDKLLKPADLNLLKQEAKNIKNRVYGMPSDAARELSTDLNNLYKTSIDSTEAEAIDKNLRTGLAKLGMSSSLSKPQLKTEEVERLTDKLLKKTIKASESQGNIEFKKTEDAFKSLLNALPEGSPERLELEKKITTLKDDAYKSFLSDITRGHNTFAISPGNLNWTMTAAGKLGFASEGVGAMYRGITNTTPAKLIRAADDMRQKGYQKYADTLNKIANTEDVSKRRALTFTLIQNPEFRNLMTPDMLGSD